MARWNQGLTPDESTYVGNMRAARNPGWEDAADGFRRQHEADAARAQAQAQGYGGAYSQEQSQRAAERGETFDPEESRVSTADEIRGEGGSVYVGTVEVEYDGVSQGPRNVNSYVQLDESTLEAIEQGEMDVLDAINSSGVMGSYGAPDLQIAGLGGVSW